MWHNSNMERIGRRIGLSFLHSRNVSMLLDHLLRHNHELTSRALPVTARLLGVFQDHILHRPNIKTLHTSASCEAARTSKTKKKIVKKVGFRSKGGKNLEVAVIKPEMTLQELADCVGRDIDHVYKVLEFLNIKDYKSAKSVVRNPHLIKMVVEASGYRWRVDTEDQQQVAQQVKDAVRRPTPDPTVLKKRPPVVTIMGHVDHGKTTLLDALRKTNVVAQEFGGITQHIGAFSVTLPSGDQITFLDTPGHAAFSSMRARGANVTDIVVLVVAADDGVMRQTVESIELAKQAGVPVIVAINKCDKPDANVEYTKQSLSEHGIFLEELGGDVQSVQISALKGLNLDVLQEAIVAQAEILEIQADPTGAVEGSVIESRTHPGRGRLSTALIQRGTLKKGAVLVAGSSHAKVRNMFNDKGRSISEAGPGQAVEIIGWKDLPSAGELILEVESEQRAKEVIDWRKTEEEAKKLSEDAAAIQKKKEEHEEDYQAKRQLRMESGRRTSKLFFEPRKKEAEETSTGPELAIVVKADVDGTLEAILDTLVTYDSDDQCHLHIVGYGVGDVTESDVELASTFNGSIYAFNVKTPDGLGSIAKTKGTPVHHHNVIYKMIDSLKEELTSRLPPLKVEDIIGEANVLQMFLVSEGKKKVPIAGCRCTSGSLHKKKYFKLVRDAEVIYEGTIDSLKHFKNEVDTIKVNVECGLSFKDKSIMPQPGDTVICYDLVETAQTLHWDLDF